MPIACMYHGTCFAYYRSSGFSNRAAALRLATRAVFGSTTYKMSKVSNLNCAVIVMRFSLWKTLQWLS